MKSLLPPIAGTMALSLVLLILILVRQNGHIDEIRDRMVAERAGHARDLDQVRGVVQARDRELQTARDAIAQLQRELAVSRAAAGIEADRERNDSDPAVIEFRRRQQRRLVQERYGDLFERLDLSPESLEEFKQLLIELEKPGDPRPVGVDLGASSGESSGAPTRRSVTSIHDDIYYLLGYEDYMTFDRYGRELTTARPLVRRFASDAADMSLPVTSVQRSALSKLFFDILDPQTNADAAKSGANKPDPATGLSPLDSQILARATEVLTRPQVELLRRFLLQERAGLDAWRSSLPAARGPAADPLAEP